MRFASLSTDQEGGTCAHGAAKACEHREDRLICAGILAAEISNESDTAAWTAIAFESTGLSGSGINAAKDHRSDMSVSARYFA